MNEEKTIIELSKISDEICDLSEAKKEMEDSDFHSCVETQIRKAYLLGLNSK